MRRIIVKNLPVNYSQTNIIGTFQKFGDCSIELNVS